MGHGAGGHDQPRPWLRQLRRLRRADLRRANRGRGEANLAARRSAPGSRAPRPDRPRGPQPARREHGAPRPLSGPAQVRRGRDAGRVRPRDPAAPRPRDRRSNDGWTEIQTCGQVYNANGNWYDVADGCGPSDGNQGQTLSYGAYNYESIINDCTNGHVYRTWDEGWAFGDNPSGASYQTGNTTYTSSSWTAAGCS